MNPFLHHIYYSGGNSSSEPESEALFARGSFTDDEKEIINDAIKKLKDDVQWDYLITAKIYGVSSEVNALLDWVNESYNGTKVGSPVFTAYEGWTGTGSTNDYIRSHFNPNGIISQNNAIAIGWEMSNQAANSYIFGCQNAGNEGLFIITKSAANATNTRLNSSANDTVAISGNPVGFWTLERNLSSEYNVYHGHNLRATHSKVSSLVPDLEIYDLVTNNAGTPGNAGTRQIGARIIASGDADYSKIGDAINDCLVRLNALGL